MDTGVQSGVAVEAAGEDEQRHAQRHLVDKHHILSQLPQPSGTFFENKFYFKILKKSVKKQQPEQIRLAGSYYRTCLTSIITADHHMRKIYEVPEAGFRSRPVLRWLRLREFFS